MKLGEEAILQINLLNWFYEKYPEFADDVYHFAGERVCSVQQGRTLKRMGVKRGVADLFLAVPRGTFGGLWLELKVNNGKLSGSQRDFLERMINRGYAAACVNGMDAAKALLISYLEENAVSK